MQAAIKLLLAAITTIGLTQCVKVSVYYEALCPDSVNFIARQLYPSYSKLKPYLELEFIPYGKATHNYVDNKWQFDCQHGHNECRGNKYQCCALSQDNDQDKDVSFVNCVMRQRDPSNTDNIKKCAEKYHLNWNNISSCATSPVGDELLAESGNKTFSLEENISFVPTIIYDDKYDDHLQDVSLTDFPAVVCSKITGDKPSICYNKRIPKRRNFLDYF